MRWSFRRVFSLVLCVAVLFAGSGFASAYADGIEHDLGIEATLDSPDSAPATGGERHGCAGHLTAHLLSLTPSAELLFEATATPGLESVPDTRAVPTLPNSFFRPPRLLLA